MGHKIVLGFSGGADSTAAALLLRKNGYEVIAVTLDFTGDRVLLEKAKQQADRLGCSHHIVNISDVFKKQVEQPFIEAYRQGETPNPCLVCDTTVKIVKLIETADGLGVDRIATGHYLRLEEDDQQEIRVFKSPAVRKDQSYYFYKLPQNILRRLMMPLEKFNSKAEVLSFLNSEGFLFDQKEESQGICFVSGDRNGYLKKHLSNLPEGLFLDQEGKILGKHDGYYQFTIGQFRGIDLDRKYVVTGFDPEKNHVFLGEEKDLYQNQIVLKDISFLNGKIPKGAVHVQFRICRWGHDLKGILKMSDSAKGVLVPDEPVRAPTPGQAAVFYHGDEVLGGGTITTDCTSI